MTIPMFKEDTQTYVEGRLENINLPVRSKEIVDFIFEKLQGKYEVSIESGGAKIYINTPQDVQTLTISLNDLLLPMINFVVDSTNKKINRKGWHKEWKNVDSIYSVLYDSYRGEENRYPNGHLETIKVTTHFYKIFFVDAKGLELFLESIKELIE